MEDKRVDFLLHAASQALSQHPCNVELVRHYVSCAQEIRERKVMVWGEDIRKSVCMSCNMLLVPGATSLVRIRGKQKKHLVTTCLSCNNSFRSYTKLKKTKKT